MRCQRARDEYGSWRDTNPGLFAMTNSGVARWNGVPHELGVITEVYSGIWSIPSLLCGAVCGNSHTDSSFDQHAGVK